MLFRSTPQRALLEPRHPSRDQPGISEGDRVVAVGAAPGPERHLHLQLLQLARQPPGLAVQSLDRLHRPWPWDAQGTQHRAERRALAAGVGGEALAYLTRPSAFLWVMARWQAGEVLPSRD